MRDILEQVFGDYGDAILAVAICYAMHPMPSSDRTRLLDGLDLEPAIGDARITRKAVRDALSAIDYGSVKLYARATWERSKDDVIIFGRSGTNGGLRRTSGLDRIGLDAWNVSLAFCSDRTGRLIAAGSNIGRSMNAGAWRRMISASGSEVRLVRVLDEVRDDPQEIARMVMDGDGLSMRVHELSDQLRRALDLLRGDSRTIEHMGMEHSITCGRIGMRLSNGRWEYVQSDGSNRTRCLFTLNVFTDRPLRRIRGAVGNMGYTESSVSRFLRYNNQPCDEDATSSVLSEIEELLGSSTVLTTEDDWEDAMDLLRLRSGTLEQSRALEDSIFSDNAPRCPGWERFVMFLSTGIRTSMARVLDGRGSGLSVDDAFASASRYQAVVSNGRRMCSELSADTRCVLDLFGCLDPRCSFCDERWLCDYKSYCSKV